MLNNDSLAKSVVGLIGKCFGAIMRLPLCFPEIILTTVLIQNELNYLYRQIRLLPINEKRQVKKRFLRTYKQFQKALLL